MPFSNSNNNMIDISPYLYDFFFVRMLQVLEFPIWKWSLCSWGKVKGPSAVVLESLAHRDDHLFLSRSSLKVNFYFVYINQYSQRYLLEGWRAAANIN